MFDGMNRAFSSLALGVDTSLGFVQKSKMAWFLSVLCNSAKERFGEVSYNPQAADSGLCLLLLMLTGVSMSHCVYSFNYFNMMTFS